MLQEAPTMAPEPQPPRANGVAVPAAVAGAGAADMAELAGVVERTLGLRFAPQRHHDLRRLFAHAVPALGFDDAATCIEALCAQAPTRRQADILARHLAIGETYFWRDPAQLQVLSSHVLAPLLAARQAGTRRLRLWSAACSSGEEAYTLAMLVRGLLGDASGWQVDVLGTDVRGDALERAEQGIYGAWAFRGVPASVRARFFTPTADGRWQVVPDIRRRTRFAAGNLVRDLDAWAGADFDLIVCRNLLMYFGADQAARVAAGLRHCLAADGWLALGAADMPATPWDGYDRVQWPEATLLRRCDAACPGGGPDRSGRPSQRGEPAGDPWNDARRIRAWADQGRTAEALAACVQWLRGPAAHDARAHHLHALILQEHGAPAPLRRAALQQALRCDEGFVLAHFALGHLARADGRLQEASCHWQRVQQLLADHRPQQAVVAGDGMTAAALGAVVAALLAQEPAP